MGLTLPLTQRAKLVEKYIKSAESNESEVHYNALQTAAYERDLHAVTALLDHYTLSGRYKLISELTYINNAEDGTHENILHVAMKDRNIFKLCCNTLSAHGLLEKSILQGDMDGDTILHQVVEFGRPDALAILQADESLHDCLKDALQTANHHGETPNDLADNFEKTSTFTSLMENGILSTENLATSSQHREAIQGVFNDIQKLESKMSYR